MFSAADIHKSPLFPPFSGNIFQFFDFFPKIGDIHVQFAQIAPHTADIPGPRLDLLPAAKMLQNTLYQRGPFRPGGLGDHHLADKGELVSAAFRLYAGRGCRVV